VDVAIKKLNQGGWVHLFGEGKVNQPHYYPQDNGVGYLPRFKWGIGRILMETTVPPTIIPMWLTGFDKMMPEGRRFPYKFLPRLGANVSITFGDPLPSENIKAALRTIMPKQSDTFVPSNTVETRQDRIGGERMLGWMGAEATRELSRKWNTVEQGTRRQGIEEDIKHIRSEVTAVVQRAVEALGRQVSGDTLR